jgi:hypothetical protein
MQILVRPVILDELPNHPIPVLEGLR